MIRVGLIVGIGVNLNSSPNLKTKSRTVYGTGAFQILHQTQLIRSGSLKTSIMN